MNLSKSKSFAFALSALFLIAPIQAGTVAAAERYPEVARLSFVSGGVTLSRGDDPDQWDDAVENAPLTVGDRLFTATDGRAELQLPSGNFIRLAARSYLSTLNLAEDVKQFYLGEGAAVFEIRRRAPDEVFEIDTPNVSVTFDEPGRYRVGVDDNGDSRIAVRRGRASLAANGRQITVENSEIRIYGAEAPRYEIVALPADDGFDHWAAERDERFERAYADAYRYSSEDIIGAEDLAGHGRWERIPDYGYAWTPTVVAAGWSPFSNGRWYWKDPWGWSWISNDRWGWATSHYGRWTPYRSRWYWVPVRPRTRVRYAPACVEFVRVRDHVGWFPLHPRDRHLPWWERRGRRFDHNVIYANRSHVTVIHHNHFITARPVHRHLVRDAVIVRDAQAARFTEALPIPSRNSLRLVTEDGRRRGERPSQHVLDRVAVVRTAPSAPPRAFQEKLSDIQKNQGRPIEPEKLLTNVPDERRAGWVRIRPAAEGGRGDFGPRTPDADSSRQFRPVPQQADRNDQPQKQTAAPRQSPPDTWEQRRLEQLERQARQREQEVKAQQSRREQVKQFHQDSQAAELRRQEAARREQALRQQQQAQRDLQLRQRQAGERAARELQRPRQEIEPRQVQQQQSREQALPQPQPHEPQRRQVQQQPVQTQRGAPPAQQQRAPQPPQITPQLRSMPQPQIQTGR